MSLTKILVQLELCLVGGGGGGGVVAAVINK